MSVGRSRRAVMAAACLMATSCAFRASDSPYLRPIPPNLHTTAPLTYDDSPLGSLVRSAFPPGGARDHSKGDSDHFVGVLDAGEDALLARVHLIRAAQKTVSIQTFIWSDDETGRYLLRELFEAAERGVAVRILIDQLRTPGPLARAASIATAHPQLEIRHYNPVANRLRSSWWRSLGALLTHFQQVNQRMHNKLWIIDDRMAIIGGRNVANAYYDRGETRNFKDRDLLVIGPVVSEMTDSFAAYWTHPLAVSSRGLADVGRIIRRGAFQTFEPPPLDPDFRNVDRRASDRTHLRQALADPMMRVSRVEFIADLPWKNLSFGLRGGGVTTTRFVELLSEARESVTMQTPYLVLAAQGRTALQDLRRRHPDIDLRISTNSLAATDSMYAYAMTDQQKERMAERVGLRVFELKPAPADIRTFWGRYARAADRRLCIHAKSYVIDGRVLWIGSFNLDPRSANLNTEAGLIVRDAAVAQAVEKNILRDMDPRNSWAIGLRRPVALVSPLRRFIGRIADLVPVLDLWPFRGTRSFELREGEDPAPFQDDRFHERYDNVGPFPKTTFGRRLRIRFLRFFVGLAFPLL